MITVIGLVTVPIQNYYNIIDHIPYAVYYMHACSIALYV